MVIGHDYDCDNNKLPLCIHYSTKVLSYFDDSTIQRLYTIFKSKDTPDKCTATISDEQQQQKICRCKISCNSPFIFIHSIQKKKKTLAGGQDKTVNVLELLWQL